MDELRQLWPEWEIVEVIGQGSYGTVLKAKRSLQGYEDIYSAIKIVNLPLNNAELSTLKSSGMDFHTIRTYYQDMAEKLIAEISIMESLKNVNEIVHIQDFKIIEDPDHISWRIYIRMELLDNINDYAQRHPFTQEDVIKLGTDICRGLDKCQQKGIIHRDIKPANILVDEYGTFKLGDFGIARQVGESLAASTKAGAENYMAPEIYRGESYDQSVDIYSLGITMYQFLNNGRMPFLPQYPQPMTANDIVQARMQRVQGAPLPPPVNADAQLAKIVLKACSFDPRDRYQSAREMLYDLERVNRNEDIPDPLPPVPPKKTSPLPFIIGGAVAALLVVALVIFFLVGRKDKTTTVDLLSDVELHYVENSAGTYTIDVNNSYFGNYYDTSNEDATQFVQTIDKNKHYNFSRINGLNAGDEVEVSVNISSQDLQTYHVKLLRTSTKVTVTISNSNTIRYASGYDNSSTSSTKSDSSYYTESAGTVVATTPANIRVSPNKYSAKITDVSAGRAMHYTGEYWIDSRGVKWYHVSFQGRTRYVDGWISSKVVRKQ